MSKIEKSQIQDHLKEDRISVIEINGYLYGIEILKSREVFPLPDITPVPNTTPFIVGVFNLRGEIYTLADISTVLGMEAKILLKTDMVILLESQKVVVGVLADRVHGVRLMNVSSITPATGVVPKAMLKFISGMVVDKSTEIFLLNVDRLLSTLTANIGY